MNYEEIMRLTGRDLSIAVAVHLFQIDPNAGTVRPYTARWNAFGDVLEWLHRERVVYRMGNDPRGDCFFSVRLGNEWIGARGYDERTAGCRCALMVALQQWPATVSPASLHAGLVVIRQPMRQERV